MEKTYIIAEIGINHNGSMDIAKELIDIADHAGCNAVKFQKRTIEDVYTPEELDKTRESPWGTTNREQKEGLEFNIEQYKELEHYTKLKGLDFIVSCWDINSINEIENNCNVRYHKVASALLTDIDFLKRLNLTNKPIILSTGMSSEEEVDAALEVLDNVEYILACTSTYPTNPKEVNLKYIETLKEIYPSFKIGFSNHYNGLLGCYGAVTLGAECIEYHITKDRTMYGSDQAASIEHTYDLVDGIRTIEKLLGNGRKIVYESEVPVREKLRKTNTLLPKIQ